jgi:hypothetical protein
VRPDVLPWTLRCFRNELKKKNRAAVRLYLYCTVRTFQVARLLLSSGEAYASYQPLLSRDRAKQRQKPGRKAISPRSQRSGDSWHWAARPRQASACVRPRRRRRRRRTQAPRKAASESRRARARARPATSDLVPRISFCRCQRQRRSVTCMLMEASTVQIFTGSLPVRV